MIGRKSRRGVVIKLKVLSITKSLTVRTVILLITDATTIRVAARRSATSLSGNWAR
jgi:hypothetical protein